MSAYLAEPHRLTHLDEKRCEAQPHSDLRSRFLAWHSGLPEVSRTCAFAMLEIEQTLNTQGKYLSSIMLNLGGRRKRKWSSSG